MQAIKLNFLAAADGTALTKQYTREEDGTITTNPYPFVRNFDSYEYEVTSLNDWLEALKAHSELGHCFLKGKLDRKLVNEPRAGHTSPSAATRTMLLDLDFNSGFRDIEDFLYQLDPMFKNVSYILQHSNSAGITGPVGLRAHLGFMSAKDMNVAHIKAWLQYKNLTVKPLSDLITLSANGMSLKYPLDITTCQNDKIIYTARPQCTNFDDPLKDERILVVQKEQECITGSLEFTNPQLVQQLVDDKVAELREKTGLKKRKASYSKQAKNGQQLLTNPDKAIVTGVKQGNGQWTYLNLNDGDSWGYYHNKERPDLLYNFKGEPNVRLKDIVPDYYDSLHAEEKTQEIIPMVFRDRERDVYYNVIYNPNTKTIDSLDPVGSKDKMKDFMEQYGKALPEPIEDWRVEFDPRTTEVYQERHKWINSFSPSIYLRTDYKPVPRIPYLIDRVLTSICVDKEYKDHFINWLAYLYQFREKTIVCPVFHGIQGTGKGLLQEKILQPLFGFEHTPKLTTQQFKDQFNGWMEKAIIAVWDEAEQGDSFNAATYDKAKHIISEYHMTLRLMRQNPIKFRNYVNLMVFTNHPFPFPLDPNDRRFSPAPPQLVKLEISEAEVDAIEDELEMFAAYLQNYKVDSAKARTILYNQARTDMINGSANTVDAFFYALRDGDLDYFLGFLRDRTIVTPDPTYNEFTRVLRRWCADQGSTYTSIVTPDEAMAAFSYIIKKYDLPAKFRKMGEKYHFKKERGMVNGKQTRGWIVEWKLKDREVYDTFTQPEVAKLKVV